MKLKPIAVPPEPIAVVGQHRIAKLRERAVGRMTYEVGVGASGAVFQVFQPRQQGLELGER